MDNYIHVAGSRSMGLQEAKGTRRGFTGEAVFERLAQGVHHYTVHPHVRQWARSRYARGSDHKVFLGGQIGGRGVQVSRLPVQSTALAAMLTIRPTGTVAQHSKL